MESLSPESSQFLEFSERNLFKEMEKVGEVATAGQRRSPGPCRPEGSLQTSTRRQ